MTAELPKSSQNTDLWLTKPAAEKKGTMAWHVLHVIYLVWINWSLTFIAANNTFKNPYRITKPWWRRWWSYSNVPQHIQVYSVFAFLCAVVGNSAPDHFAPIHAQEHAVRADWEITKLKLQAFLWIKDVPAFSKVHLNSCFHIIEKLKKVLWPSCTTFRVGRCSKSTILSWLKKNNANAANELSPIREKATENMTL